MYSSILIKEDDSQINFDTNDTKVRELIDNPHISGTELQIITPKNITYNMPMNGYFPATYGFESIKANECPEGWEISESGGIGKIIDLEDGHNKVFELYDDSDIYSTVANNSFQDQTSGTIELWIKLSEQQHTGISICDGDREHSIYFAMMGDGYFAYYDGIIWNYLIRYIYNEWYHLRFDFDCNDAWHLWINNINIDLGGGYAYRGSVSQMDRISIYTGDTTTQTYSCYIDAVGYSWDSHYDVGDNINEGLLVSFENNTNIDGFKYSLDNNPNITINGNTVLPFPANGIHTIQLFGSNSTGSILSEL